MAKKAVTPAPPGWRDRVLRFERIPAHALQSHDGNWRTHPQFQADALLGALREVGIAGALLVYHSPARDGALVTIDGHLRKALDSTQEWPCLVLDVDDDEAAYILATHDPLSAIAHADIAQLRALLETVQSGEASVQTLLSELAEAQGLVPPSAPDNPLEHWQGMPDFHQEDQLGVQQIIVHFKSYADVKAFADLVGQSVTPKTKYLWYPEEIRQEAVWMESHESA